MTHLMPNPPEPHHHTPVAIVGGGPVGLALALFLDRHNVASVVFNTEAETRWHPKGSTHNARTMEHYRRLGIAAQLRQLGLPQDYPGDVAYFTRFNAYELARLPMPSAAQKAQAVASSHKLDQQPEPLLRANQMYIEAFLLEHVRTRRNVTLRFGWEVTSFEQNADGVSVSAQSRDDGRSEVWRAAYLVGCDGGRSFVRRQLGIRYAGWEALQQAYLGGRMISSHIPHAHLLSGHPGQPTRVPALGDQPAIARPARRARRPRGVPALHAGLRSGDGTGPRGGAAHGPHMLRRGASRGGDRLAALDRGCRAGR
jgi:2-polyprenyl-6-methoxyphenol hydroxylase-like FAD-dependent oxidoreductase